MMLDYMVKEKEQSYGAGAQRSPNGYQANSTTSTTTTTDSLLARQRSLATSYPVHVGLQTATSCAGGELAATGGAGNELIGYYFGSISRETAEWILRTHGKQTDGAYLLRSSGPSDDFVLSLLVNPGSAPQQHQHQLEVLHYKIVETEDSFVALHGQVGDEKFATIDELIDKAQGVATRPRLPILRHSLEWHILPPTFWGLSVDQVRWAILIKARQWGFPLAAHLFQQQPAPVDTLSTGALNRQSCQANQQETTLNNETIRTLIHKSLHEFQPWFHGKISREEAERRVAECGGSGGSGGWPARDGRFLVRERDNYSYAMCISHRNTTKHYRIDVLPTGELAIQDGRKFTSLMALVSHYTITNDGLWCALTEACPRPIAAAAAAAAGAASPITMLGLKQAPSITSTSSSTAPSGYHHQLTTMRPNNNTQAPPCHGLYCTAASSSQLSQARLAPVNNNAPGEHQANNNNNHHQKSGFICAQQGSMASLKAPIKEWLQAINQRWSQLVASQRNHHNHHSTISLNSFLFGHQNPLNNHCDGGRGRRRRACLSTGAQAALQSGMQPQPQQTVSRLHRKCKNGHLSCGCLAHQQLARQQQAALQLQATANGVVGKVNGGGELPACETMAARLLHLGVDVSNVAAHNCGANSTPANCPSGYQKGAPLEHPLASNLPQLSSGFALNGQSFVGSPLFAVNNQSQQAAGRQPFRPNGKGGSSSSGGSGGSAADNASDHLPTQGDTCSSLRLISPIQSVCGFGQQQQTVDQIYESSRAASSGMMNGLISGAPGGGAQRSSVAGSSHQQLVQSHYGSGSTATTLQAYSPPTSLQPQPQPHQHHQPFNIQQQQQQPTSNSSRQPLPAAILCGQHAGPAFRYTNCHDQSHLRPCAHYRRTTGNAKALDDLQLPTGSSPLAPPAALTRFVQFQDGQCLRTHRDTQSIQQAYLWAARHHTSGPHSGPPPSRLGPNSISRARPEPIYGNPAAAASAAKPLASQQPTTTTQANINNKQQEAEVDLMYCGDADEDHLLQHHFKYDPRQIKSSSIETLCGVGVDKERDEELEEENLEEVLDNCKSNSELIMSLQSSYWMPQPAKPQPYLNPTQLVPATCAPDNMDPFPAAPQHSTDNNSTGVVQSLGSASSELLESQLRKKHDLDELTTTVLAELDASLKAQVELKNKRAGFGFLAATGGKRTASENNNQPPLVSPASQTSQQTVAPQPATGQVNPLELINEFDTLISNNR